MQLVHNYSHTNPVLTFHKINFNNILTSMSRSWNMSLPFRLATKLVTKFGTLLCVHTTAYLIFHNLFMLMRLGKQNSWSSSLCSFLQPRVTSSLLRPNILLSTLFSNTLGLNSSLNITDQVEYQHTTAAKIVVSQDIVKLQPEIESDTQTKEFRFIPAVTTH
jgi:hypothetical protein